MKIVLVTSKLNFKTAGGSVIDLHLKAKGLVNLGHQVTVVTAFSGANMIEEALPYTLFEEDIKTGHLLGIQKGIYKILKKYKKSADVYYIDGHIFIYGGGLYRWFGGEIPVLGFFNIRLNCWADTQENNTKTTSVFTRLKKKFRLFLEKTIGVFLANKLDAFVFNTPMVKKLYMDFGYHDHKSSVIEDFVDTQKIILNNRLTGDKIKLHHQESNILIFCSGRLIKEKGFDLVIKAFNSLKDKTKYKVIISGGGSYSPSLKSLVSELGLTGFFDFPGWVKKEELYNLFRRAHIFIFPKWWIEYGSVILTEAMAFGLPCIVPAGGALAWLSKGASITFEPDNYQDLAEKIKSFSIDSELRVISAKNALEKAASIDYKILTTKLEIVLNSIAR